MYEEFGDELVHHLNGMFAFALWDSRSDVFSSLAIVSGSSRSTTARAMWRLHFASETKAILAAVDVPRELDREALHEYLALGYVPAPLSLFARSGSCHPAPSSSRRVVRTSIPILDTDR